MTAREFVTSEIAVGQLHEGAPDQTPEPLPPPDPDPDDDDKPIAAGAL